jgi:osmotically-inducible protein OsmY
MKRGSLFAILALTLLAAGWMGERALNQHDDSILADLNAQLASDEKFQNVRGQVKGRVIALTGSVMLLQDKQLLLSKARQIDRVKLVKDDIVVETVYLSDRSLRRDVYERLQAEDFAQVALKVRKGTITVRGELATKADRERVLAIVSGTRGVRAIVDQTSVHTLRQTRPRDQNSRGNGEP